MEVWLEISRFLLFAIPVFNLAHGQRQYEIGPHFYPDSLEDRLLSGGGPIYPDYNYYDPFDNSQIPLLLRPPPQSQSRIPSRDIKRTQTLPQMPPPPPQSMQDVGMMTPTGPQGEGGPQIVVMTPTAPGQSGNGAGPPQVIMMTPTAEKPQNDMGMELFYDYYEYGNGPGPDYYPGPAEGPLGPPPSGGGWYPQPPPPPPPQNKPVYKPIHNKPVHKPVHKPIYKPIKPPVKGKPKPEGVTDGWGQGPSQTHEPQEGWTQPQQGQQGWGQDKLSELKDKWNSLVEKLKIKDKGKDKEKFTEQYVEKVPQGYPQSPGPQSAQGQGGQFQLEHLPGWNAPPPRYQQNQKPPQNYPEGVRQPPPQNNGGGGGWGQGQNQPSGGGGRPILEIWFGPWFRRDRKEKDEKK